MSELVKIKGTENVGCVDGYNDGLYIVTLENGSQGWYAEEELEFLNIASVQTSEHTAIKNLIVALNSTKQFECMDLDNDDFISYICKVAELTPHTYKEIMKEYFCDKPHLYEIRKADMIIVDLLVEYLKESNWNEDGSPSNDDSYYKVVQIKTERPISEIRAEADEEDWVEEMMDSDDVKEIFAMEEYVEDTLRVVQVLSEVGHEC